MVNHLEIRERLKWFTDQLTKRIEANVPSRLDYDDLNVMAPTCMLYYWRATLHFALESYVAAALDAWILIVQFPKIALLQDGLIKIYVLSLFRTDQRTSLDRFFTEQGRGLVMAEQLRLRQAGLSAGFFSSIYQMITLNLQYTGCYFLNINELFWYQDSPSVPNMYDGTAVVSDPVKGRKVIATTKFNKGQKIAVKEKPLLSISDRYENVCDHCLKALPRKFVICDLCRHPKYCSDECKRVAYNQYHQILCQTDVHDLFLLSQEGISSSSNVVIAAARLLAMAIRFRCDLLYMPLMKYLSLPAHQLIINWDTLSNLTILSQQMGHLFDPRYAPWKLIIAQAKIMINSFGNLHQMNVYQAASMFNHSCLPVLEENMRLNRRIEKGDEITINYGKHFGKQSNSDWGLSVFVSYGFVCDCEKCKKAAIPEKTWKQAIELTDLD